FFIIILFSPFSATVLYNFVKKEHHKLYIKQYIRSIPKVAMFQFIFISLTVFQYYVLIEQYFHISIGKLFIGVPLILSSNTIPITYSGLGLRETFAISVLSKFDIDPLIAVTASLTIFFFNSVIPALIGLYLLINKKKK
ncbi:MAG: lysylphosphatidylglycerol synthase domain-containing protein, partial [Candidatus Cloacimonetes bacterium]|nr:lysylphosphatidylglycerol synthase domain-containing protein [Candidatus Cloacimonadota bacterium]